MPRRTTNTRFEASRDDVYEMEAIGAKRRKGRSIEYFRQRNTWEPMPHLEGPEKLVLPAALPGVTWALPGLLFWDFCGPKMSAFLNLKLLKQMNFT